MKDNVKDWLKMLGVIAAFALVAPWSAFGFLYYCMMVIEFLSGRH